MVEPQRHEMRLERTHTTSADEWFCPTCGRRFLMQWPPDYKKIMLEVGDEQAIHSGGKDGLHVGPVEARPGGIDDDEITPETPCPLSDELRAWLREAGFEAWWYKDD